MSDARLAGSGEPARRLNRAESKALTRARLIASAVQVFTLRGYFAATVEEVAEVAGFSKGAVYSNFESKEDLFLAMVEQHIDERIEWITELADSAAGDVDERAEAADDAFGKVLDEERDWVLLMFEFVVVASRRPELQERYARSYRKMRAAVAELMDRRATEFGIDVNVSGDVIAAATFAMGNGVAMEHLADPTGVPDGLFGLMLSRFFR